MGIARMRLPSIVTSVLYVGFVAWSLYGRGCRSKPTSSAWFTWASSSPCPLLVFPLSKKAGSWTRWLDVRTGDPGSRHHRLRLVDLDKFIRRSTLPDPADFIMGVIAILLLVEISPRAVDITFTLVLVGFLLYAFLGNYLPGPLSHKATTSTRIVGHMYMTLEGILRGAARGQRVLRDALVVYGPSWTPPRRHLLAGAVAGGDGAQVLQRRTRCHHHHGPAGRAPGQRGGHHHVVTPVMWPILKKAGYSADMAAGLIPAGGIGSGDLAAAHGCGRLPHHAVPERVLLDVVIMVTVPTLLYYIGTSSWWKWRPQIQLHAARNFRQIGLGGHAHPRLPPDLFGRAHHSAGMGRSPEDSAIWALLATSPAVS